MEPILELNLGTNLNTKIESKNIGNSKEFETNSKTNI